MAVLAALTLSAGGGPAAGADPIDDKRAEAAAIATKLEEQARRIVTLDAQHRTAQDELADAQTGVAATERELAAAVERQAQLKRQLVIQAQDAYVVGGSVTVLKYLVRTNQGDEVARRAYLRIVTGQDRRLIDLLKAAREDLADRRDRLEAARRRAKAKTDAIAEDRLALDRAVRLQRGVLQQVNGKLAGLVAAEQARRDAEAARLAAATRPAADAGAAAPAAAPEVGLVPTLLQGPVGDTFSCIRQLESGNNYATPGGGAYQFLDSTWHSLGYSGTASDAPPAVQDEAAVKLQAQSGWSQWTTAPLCGRA